MTKKIVLIDDDPEDIEIMLELLKEISPSASTLTFTDPCYALDVLKDMNGPVLPDYIILDVEMPTMSGLECLTQLRALGKLDHVKFLIHSTAAPSKTMVEEFKKLDAQVFQKPANLSAFSHYFRTFLAQTEQQ